ncbi:MAG: hypothetical protein R3E01_31955 [Pirellulaceae bacterium]|nr:hypothetical protein [Planctomycetales bacterium]
MAKDPRKHQKKIERRRAKERRKSAGAVVAQGMAGRMTRISVAPILHSCCYGDLDDQGMTQALISRRLHGGDVAFAIFLLDTYCLGVKDVTVHILPRSEYDRTVVAHLAREFAPQPMSPNALRKLVEGAVEYARKLGFSPHRDYRKAAPIFGDLDATSCGEEFEYGKDGRPLYISGPNESSAKMREIISRLDDACGQDEYRVVALVDGNSPLWEDAMMEEDDTTAEDYEDIEYEETDRLRR